jgi:hypothetical protein
LGCLTYFERTTSRGRFCSPRRRWQRAVRRQTLNVLCAEGPRPATVGQDRSFELAQSDRPASKKASIDGASCRRSPLLPSASTTTAPEHRSMPKGQPVPSHPMMKMFDFQPPANLSCKYFLRASQPRVRARRSRRNRGMRCRAALRPPTSGAPPALKSERRRRDDRTPIGASFGEPA